MALIKSISGFRGTIGGQPGDNLTPPDLVRFAAAFASFIQAGAGKRDIQMVVGRDARISGPMVQGLVTNTLIAMGVHVVDAGLTTTPTVEMAVSFTGSDAGIILTASHNPMQWNALKLLNRSGEFISAVDGAEVLTLADSGDFSYAPVEELGSCRQEDFMDRHIEAVLKMALVNREAIRKASFRIAVDAVNSSGGIYVPALLQALGLTDVHLIHCQPNGRFSHNPEPLPEHLGDIAGLVREKHCHLGIVVDPDVDRLALVCEDGTMFGEEYTLVAVADYVLEHTPGNTVSNLSSTRALRDVTIARGGNYAAAAVGEVNVVEKMKETRAVIGGEGNGGIIVPDLHFGRDALAGIALFLSGLATKNCLMTDWRNSLPQYKMSKNKIELQPGLDLDLLLLQVQKAFPEAVANTVDGLKLDFQAGWVHLRKSNTEPIIRVYSESISSQSAEELAAKVLAEIQQLV